LQAFGVHGAEVGHHVDAAMRFEIIGQAIDARASAVSPEGYSVGAASRAGKRRMDG
jgi:hypothetical protein